MQYNTAEKDLKKLKEDFEKDFKVSVELNQSFHALIEEILKGESEKEFMIKTGLGTGMFFRIRKKTEENSINKSTIVAICIGYKLDCITAQKLLHSLGLCFNHSRRDYAYFFLLTQCRGKDIDECNAILEYLGIKKQDQLGHQFRKK